MRAVWILRSSAWDGDFRAVSLLGPSIWPGSLSLFFRNGQAACVFTIYVHSSSPLLPPAESAEIGGVLPQMMGQITHPRHNNSKIEVWQQGRQRISNWDAHFASTSIAEARLHTLDQLGRTLDTESIAPDVAVGVALLQPGMVLESLLQVRAERLSIGRQSQVVLEPPSLLLLILLQLFMVVGASESRHSFFWFYFFSLSLET